MMLIKNAKKRHPCFGPHLREKASRFLSIMLDVGFCLFVFQIFSYEVEAFPSTLNLLLIFIMNGYCILLNAFLCIY